MSDFLAFARANGLLVDHVIADDRVHRVPTTAHPRKRNGAYRWNGRTGFVQAWDIHESAIAYRADASVDLPTMRDMNAMVARAAAQKAREQREAAHTAREILGRCEYKEHPYLAAKGFPTHKGLVDTDGRLVVPMRDVENYDVLSVQHIDDTGAKRFLKGGQAKGAIFRIGRGSETWLVEGYATALSVDLALHALYRQASVLVCFSAGNLAHVANRVRGRRFVFADNDASNAGQHAAESTGLPWVMSPVMGEDANDLHRRAGLPALCELLQGVL